MVNYKNRHGEQITFKRVEGGVLMSGGTYYRCGLLLDYSESYKEYLQHNTHKSLEDFINLIENDNEVWVKYEEFVTVTDKLSFVDPSGGPLISIDYHLEDIGEEFKNLVVKEIVTEGSSYLLKV